MWLPVPSTLDAVMVGCLSESASCGLVWKLAGIFFIVVFSRVTCSEVEAVWLLEIEKQVQPEIVGLAHTLVFSSYHIAGNVADKGQSRRKATVFKVWTQAVPVPQQVGTRQNQLKGAQVRGNAGRATTRKAKEARIVCFRLGISISGHSRAGPRRVRRSLAVDDGNPQEQANEEPRQKFSILESCVLPDLFSKALRFSAANQRFLTVRAHAMVIFVSLRFPSGSTEELA